MLPASFQLSASGVFDSTLPKPGSSWFQLPGLVNAHSHSFQRAMRGLVETPHPENKDNFWSWREMMYAIAAKALPEDFETLATWCFLDALKTGFCNVGEFHYVHHQPGGHLYEPSYLIAQRIARAASRVGMRLTLLHTGYHTSAPNEPALPAQRQFTFETVKSFLAHVDAARSAINGPLVNHGLALHSIRACPRSWLRDIAAYSRDNNLPLHIHVSEQSRELELCEKAYGMSPIALLKAEHVLGDQTTLVHGTHVSEQDIEMIAEANAIVCICPSTERNLGDGMAPIEQFLEKDIRITIGTDSHARMDVVDEMRSLEDHERLRLEKRLIWARHQKSMFENMIPVVCQNGYASLGVTETSSDAVFVKIPSFLKDCPSRHIAENWLVGGSGHDVTDVFINDECVLKNSQSTRLEEEDLFEKVSAFLRKVSLS